MEGALPVVQSFAFQEFKEPTTTISQFLDAPILLRWYMIGE